MRLYKYKEIDLKVILLSNGILKMTNEEEDHHFQIEAEKESRSFILTGHNSTSFHNTIESAVETAADFLRRVTLAQDTYEGRKSLIKDFVNGLPEFVEPECEG